jgi:glycerol uptake facilitator-like aquaporin
MPLDNRLERSNARERHNQQIARSIRGLGVIAAVLCIARALFARNKARAFGPIFSFVIIPLAAILLAACLCAFLKKRLDGFQREGTE